MFPHKNVFPVDSDPANRLQMIGDSQWLSQNAFANVDADQVDWAALAQQWIHMKGTCIPAPPMLIPCAPPPPKLSVPVHDFEEQGEAPMEVEHDDEPHESITHVAEAPPPPTNLFATSTKNYLPSSHPNDSNRQPKQWNNKKQNRWNQPNQPNQHRSKRGNGNDNFHANASRPMKVWQSTTTTTSPPPPPSLLSTSASGSNETRFDDVNTKSGTTPVGIGDTMSMLDASQRKKLPAWIREGLEKMEREKQRQLDRDREMKERDEKRRQEKLLEQNVLMQFNATESIPLIPAKSKFESDSESDSDSDDDKSNNVRHASENVPTKSITTQAAAITSPMGICATTVGSSTRNEMATITSAINQPRSKADILTEIMLSVRTNLTEILLEVTSEEISAIAQETISNYRSKGRKPQIVQKIAKTANSTPLGLVLYDDSDASRSDYDSDTMDNRRGHDSDDSEIELKRTIQRKKHAFEAKSAEIEVYLNEKACKEKEWLEEDDTNENVASSHEEIDGSSSLQRSMSNNDATESSSLASKNERKGSRFSDAKSLIYNVASSHMVQNLIVPQVKIQSIVPDAKATDAKKSDAKDADGTSDGSSSSGKKSKRSDRHRSKRSHRSRSRSRSHSRSKKRKRANKRSHRSSSSSDASSRQSRKSRKHSRRDRSSSDDRASRSSHSSHKRDKYARDTSSRSHSYRRSRSRSRDKHASRRRH